MDGELPVEEARLLKVLGHPLRLRIAVGLMDEAHCVGEVWSCLGIAQAEASRHLALLREVGAVSCTREGKQVRYRLENDRVRRLIMALTAPAGG
ncbi:MAG: winged helix-turn-helix transcriptional regulator [Desulfuromonadales bacterium]|nr:winged helix-turn-helix transcriptional regulator [Desulfuromonadales bacterium]NIR33425.1 winged helix-turn-helix transcriptional regulator [Desulfuromonadales bacterium]NIS42170.1 winged helix-turn-helix transcriptional regulator [Desulfuromonadales bacterium]